MVHHQLLALYTWRKKKKNNNNRKEKKERNSRQRDFKIRFKCPKTRSRTYSYTPIYVAQRAIREKIDFLPNSTDVLFEGRQGAGVPFSDKRFSLFADRRDCVVIYIYASLKELVKDRPVLSVATDFRAAFYNLVYTFLYSDNNTCQPRHDSARLYVVQRIEDRQRY